MNIYYEKSFGTAQIWWMTKILFEIEKLSKNRVSLKKI